ncbi:DNA translocase FtsK [Pseudooceanicola sediminis]|uniref:DNA translocase FtsK n=1 Tax=Pseudooceanicola sediminis TaxID=2211117 RepID=A0A399IZF1_9RHOB|nr:DNA translocase FtsK 4TM domain-containing protein [Pseudooceanicola sediminis]KAA2313386.1 DNA translocase FtsK [Puniceibacterium sp. HSS470]RII38334.1 DNA translocase FtsK [Pseudooceanicola sediminis]|tara:strand:+ start:41523 stop:44897 length:3375 start_codon:yes stop_codon:yes gene_type:complete
MAFQTKGRDPLFDSSVQEALEKRGKELIGLLLLIFGLMVAALLYSYSPADPSWMSASDAPVQNWLGRFGASIAAPMIMVIGAGGWAIAALCIVWGLRFGLHFAEEGPVGRLVFAPVFVAAVAIYAGTLNTGADWPHAFGLGGLFGDTALGALMGLLPLPIDTAIRLLAVGLGLGSAVLGLWVLGFTMYELRRMFRLMVIGLVLFYAMVLKVLGRGAAGTMRVAGSAATHAAGRGRDHLERRRAVRAERSQGAFYDDPSVQQDWQEDPWASPDMPLYDEDDERDYALAQAYDQHVPEPKPEPRPRLLGRLSSGLKRRSDPAEMPPDELVVADPVAHMPHGHDPNVPEDQRIKAKIADVVRSRARQVPVIRSTPPAPQTAPQAVRPRRPAPLVVGGAGGSAGSSRTEPPLTSSSAHQPARPFAPSPAAAPRAVGAADPRHAAYPYPDDDYDRVAAYAPASEVDLDQAAEQPFDDYDVDYEAASGAAYDAPYDHHAADAHAGNDDAGYGDPMPEDDLRNAASPRVVRGAYRNDDDDQAWLDDEASAFGEDYGAPEPGIADDHSHTKAFAPESTPPSPAAPRVSIPVAEPKKVVQHTPRKPVQPSSRAREEAQPGLAFQEAEPVQYDLPPLSLLTNPENIQRLHLSDEALEENARMLENVLDDYGVKGEIVSVRPGPVVTMYELEPAPGLKASRVIGLADDIARSMSALSARVSTVPGRSVIGIELPNETREKVVLREILSARDFGDTHMKLPLALGKDIGGEPMIANLAKMPHLLIAGTTGSGKSVAINTMILSLLYRLTPEECRLIMIDPKMLELSVYDGIPHLLSPVVTDPKKAVVALKWTVAEMEDRYRKMSKMGVRNIDGYNGRVQDAIDKGEMFSRTVQTGFDDGTGDPVFETEEIKPEKMPYIVVIVDEMADLMMVAGKEIEACIQRLAQMARASGIHLIMATQRPSVDVITGTIKANFPTRISFQVTSKIDSRTILGEMGAEQLLGMGDMLYMAGGAKITRCHGPFVSDEEVEEIVNHLKGYGPPSYVGGVVDGPEDDKADDIDAVLGLSTGGNTNGEDALYDQAVGIVIKDRKCSTSYIQRKLAIGYNKAARLVEQMEDEGVVSSANHVGKREVLVPEQ